MMARIMGRFLMVGGNYALFVICSTQTPGFFECQGLVRTSFCQKMVLY